MYSVTKTIDFCYGHRLLDYDGICKHPHGHNAVAEIEVRTGQLDSRNMVCDFSDIKRIVKGWIDKELDHKMLLRHDDPSSSCSSSLANCISSIAIRPSSASRVSFTTTRAGRASGGRVKVWETPTSFAESNQI